MTFEASILVRNRLNEKCVTLLKLAKKPGFEVADNEVTDNTIITKLLVCLEYINSLWQPDLQEFSKLVDWCLEQPEPQNTLCARKIVASKVWTGITALLPKVGTLC